MGDYFRHWIRMQRALSETPRVFHVNWFRKDSGGDFLWPGFRENSRVLAWVVRRLEGAADATDTPVGLLPTRDSLDLTGLDVPDDDLAELLRVDRDGWLAEAESTAQWLTTFGPKLPARITGELDGLRRRLEAEVRAPR